MKHVTFRLSRYAQQGNRSGSLEEPLEDKNLGEQPEALEEPLEDKNLGDQPEALEEPLEDKNRIPVRDDIYIVSLRSTKK